MNVRFGPFADERSTLMGSDVGFFSFETIWHRRGFSRQAKTFEHEEGSRRGRGLSPTTTFWQ